MICLQVFSRATAYYTYVVSSLIYPYPVCSRLFEYMIKYEFSRMKQNDHGTRQFFCLSVVLVSTTVPMIGNTLARHGVRLRTFFIGDIIFRQRRWQ